MKRFPFIGYITVLIVSMACVFSMSSCSSDDDSDPASEENYGSGSPLAENIVHLAGHQYEYNGNGLVTKISRINTTYEADGTTKTELVAVATISYPSDDTAVMQYSGDYLPTTYTFYFGANHFAKSVTTADADGDTDVTKFSYDADGHITSSSDGYDKLSLEWNDGNLTRLRQTEYNASAVLAYGNLTDFDRYNMSPFLLDVNMGPFMYSLGWWFDRGLKYALYAGFLGKPCRNLPVSRIAYDSENKEAERMGFDYSIDGMWSFYDI